MGSFNCLEGVQAAGLLNRAAGTHIHTLVDALYPTDFLIRMQHLLVGTLGHSQRDTARSR